MSELHLELVRVLLMYVIVAIREISLGDEFLLKSDVYVFLFSECSSLASAHLK